MTGSAMWVKLTNGEGRAATEWHRVSGEDRYATQTRCKLRWPKERSVRQFVRPEGKICITCASLSGESV